MALFLGRNAIAEALKDAVQIIHKAPILDHKGDGTFVYKERDDGANTHEIFEAKISAGTADFSDTIISITPIKISLVELRKITKQFFKKNGDCIINVP